MQVSDPNAVCVRGPNVDVFLMAEARDGMAITKSLTAAGGLIYGAVGGPDRVEDVHDKEPTQYWQQRTLNSEAENITWCNVGFMPLHSHSCEIPVQMCHCHCTANLSAIHGHTIVSIKFHYR